MVNHLDVCSCQLKTYTQQSVIHREFDLSASDTRLGPGHSLPSRLTRIHPLSSVSSLPARESGEAIVRLRVEPCGPLSMATSSTEGNATISNSDGTGSSHGVDSASSVSQSHTRQQQQQQQAYHLANQFGLAAAAAAAASSSSSSSSPSRNRKRDADAAMLDNGSGGGPSTDAGGHQFSSPSASGANTALQSLGNDGELDGWLNLCRIQVY